ncbi:MAG: flagellar WD repeat-containing protein Pf20 [Monoraphidium minutum]|nr:MAG: flagellar WD repeat-containing protein Pf20 [Monoraphidium minutum]
MADAAMEAPLPRGTSLGTASPSGAAPASVASGGTPHDPLLDDSDDDFEYEEVEVASDPEEDDISEDLDAAMRSLQALTAPKSGSGSAAAAKAAAAAPGTVTRRPEVIDDFIRNFCAKAGLARTAEAFEAEWYELKATGRLGGLATSMPDVYLRNGELEEELAALRHELVAAQEVAARASATWDKFRKERDFHRMHHKRVVQEKNRLITDIKRLKAHYGKYEPTILELKRKYEAAMKEKMLAGLDRDKMAAKAHDLDERVRQLQRDEAGGSPSTTLCGSPGGESGAGGDAAAAARRAAGKPAPWPAARVNPYEEAEVQPAQVNGFTLQKSFKGHLMSVANVALHPTKPILVTASDDKTWKMWHLPGGDLIMCGEGHKDWVAGIDFHPSGAGLASGSGDASVKLWSFEKQRCVATLTEHKQAVWCVKYHDSGDWLASCSLDHSVRLWDVGQGRCRQVLRGHVDSVNGVAWQPYGAAVTTGSSDKTVSTWDPRSGLSVQTYYGHKNSVNGVAYALAGGTIASVDADGVAKLWDVRMVAEIATIAAGKYPANKAAFDASGAVLAVASDDGRVKLFNAAAGGEPLAELAGHEDAVQAVAFDRCGQFLVSASSDCTFKVWGGC